MTIYIIWEKDLDADFRSAYADIVQEEIQHDPASNGSRYLVGSFRITQEHIAVLSAQFPTMMVSTEYPEEFLNADD